MPLFAWSGHSDVAKSRGADSALATAINQSPELVMVYMLNEISTNDMQTQKEVFSNLQESLNQAQSSTFAALPVSKVDVDDLLKTARVNDVNGVEVESSELQAYLAEHSELMANSKPDVIVVRFPSDMDAASTDAVIGSAEKTVSAATSGKYNSILSTISSMASTGSTTNLAAQWFFTMGDSRTFVPSLLYGNATTTRNAIQYGSTSTLTPTLLIAILITIYMGLLALAAYCCILALQTPEKFEGDQDKEMDRAMGKDK